MNILGINAYHGDSWACIVKDGKMLAAVEEERFKRIKHWAGFPVESINYCLEEANISLLEVDHVAINGLSSRGSTEYIFTHQDGSFSDGKVVYNSR